DSKWAIDYGEIGGGQVIAKLEKALGRSPGHYGRMLEVGAGTGYFTLNLLRRGVVEEATAIDISPGMLDALQVTAKRLGLTVETVEEKPEGVQHVHPFPPDELRDIVQDAGLADVRVTGEELVANAYGWILRTLESRVEPDTVPLGWHRFAFRSYLALQRVD